MTGYFWEISPDECGHLLADAAVGRVAWASSRGVQVLPVTLTSVGESVFFAVDPQSILAELAEGVDAVVQVDDLDPETATGWSVLARGRTTRHEGPRPALNPSWAPGERGVLVRLDVASLTGRSVSASTGD
ncbi:pyridoxamine 5'-phosphate oxidase family protein [Nigerium sp.]|uniref:pyridoxamine 5'-phosphate oxidase family protein n=1 Tax=Nigerium sp. TaxID=2042655 RepID=UPI003221C298